MRKIVLFGDSITAGYYKGEITDLLTTKIAQVFPKDKVVNAGIPGDTTVDGLARIKEHVLSYQPDYVTIFFGANDAATHRLVSLENYQKNLETMIEMIGREKIILLTPPYTNQTIRKFDRPVERMSQYAEVVKNIAREQNILCVDILEKMLEHSKKESFLQIDGLHFSEEGYVFLAKEMTQALRKKIDKEESGKA